MRWFVPFSRSSSLQGGQVKKNNVGAKFKALLESSPSKGGMTMSQGVVPSYDLDLVHSIFNASERVRHAGYVQVTV